MLHASVAALARALEQRYAIHLPLDEIRFLQAMFSLGQYNYYDEAKVSAMLSREKANLMQIGRNNIKSSIISSCWRLPRSLRSI